MGKWVGDGNQREFVLVKGRKILENEGGFQLREEKETCIVNSDGKTNSWDSILIYLLIALSGGYHFWSDFFYSGTDIFFLGGIYNQICRTLINIIPAGLFSSMDFFRLKTLDYGLE